MMAATHMVVAGAAGRVLRTPWLAWPAGFASYFVLDAIPHLNPEQFVQPPATQWVLVADVALGLVLVVTLSSGRPRQRVVLGSVLCAALAAVLTHMPHLVAPLDTGYLSALRRHNEHALGQVGTVKGLGMQAAFFFGGILALAVGGRARADKMAPALPRPLPPYPSRRYRVMEAVLALLRSGDALFARLRRRLRRLLRRTPGRR